jgi:Niemann-Pick C1 protein
MAGSKSYIFVLFFRQFFLICLFGSFHGLVFLPVVLSIIGSHTDRESESESEGESESERASESERERERPPL